MTATPSRALLRRAVEGARGSGGIRFWGPGAALSLACYGGRTGGLQQRQQQRLLSAQGFQIQRGHVNLPRGRKKELEKRRQSRQASSTSQVEQGTPKRGPGSAEKQTWNKSENGRVRAIPSVSKEFGSVDRVEFAKRVSRMLEQGKLDTARRAVQSVHIQGGDAIVAWNHILEYLLKTEGPQKAFKEYNDMKKRGRQPNGHTYTIMMKGCAKNQSKAALSVGMKVYRSISAGSPTVECTIMHHNAALDMCSRHYDLESLWSVAGAIPETGPNAPDCATFSIIINAIRAVANRDVENLQPKPDLKPEEGHDDFVGSDESVASTQNERQILEKKAAAVKQGKKVWNDVLHHWRTGAFAPDSRLISAMGNLLLFGGREQDYRDVLSLLRQTLAIPLGGEVSRAPLRFGIREDDSDSLSNRDKHSISGAETEPGSQEVEVAGEEFPNLFDAVDFEEVRKAMKKKHRELASRMDVTPSPTNRELCLALVAGQKLPNGVRIARKYWEMLTSSKYNVVPDHLSFHEYLRVLRRSRASAEALHFIQKEMIPCKMALPKTFTIGMSACVRDKNNPNVLHTAGILIQLMGKALLVPDPAVLDRFMDLVRKGIGKDSVPESPDKQTQYDIRLGRLSTAIQRLKPLMTKLAEVVASGGGNRGVKKGRMHFEPTPELSKDAIVATQNYQKLLHTILEPPFVSSINSAGHTPSREYFEEEDRRVRRFLGAHHRLTAGRPTEQEDGRE